MRKLLLSFLFLIYPSFAQETTTEIGANINNPDMPVLFFTREQRRVLEAVRRGVVQKEDLEIEDNNFVPVVLLEETLGGGAEPAPQQVRRTNEIRVNALIRNRTTGKAHIWLNGKAVEIGGDDDVLRRDGLVVNNEDVDSTAIVGSDELANSRFEVKVGQIINIDGKVDESLPVITRSR